MLEYSIYSVISPEGCASILYKNAEFASNAAEAMKITANDLKKLNLIDEIISEPLGGAHRNIKPVAKNITNSIVENLKYLTTLEVDSLIKKRKEKIIKERKAAQKRAAEEAKKQQSQPSGGMPGASNFSAASQGVTNQTATAFSPGLKLY